MALIKEPATANPLKTPRHEIQIAGSRYSVATLALMLVVAGVLFPAARTTVAGAGSASRRNLHRRVFERHLSLAFESCRRGTA